MFDDPGALNRLIPTVVTSIINIIYLTIVFIAYKLNNRKEYEDEVIKNKKFFNGVLIGQIVGAILAEGFCISINGASTHHATVYGVPFMIAETILCTILKYMKNKEVSAKLIKFVTVIGIIVMAILIFKTGRYVDGNIKVTE